MRKAAMILGGLSGLLGVWWINLVGLARITGGAVVLQWKSDR
ncbi:MAG: hypothetical protein DDT27_01191 [Dehalococcoidia bacterium]|nr:hypothetical protein [Chloroflexota bacterium]